MLKQRILTAVVLFLLVLAAILLLPEVGFALFMGAMVGVGAWEWSRLAGIESPPLRALYLLAFLGLLWLSRRLIFSGLDLLLWLSLLWWFCGFIFVLRYPRLANYWGRPSLLALAGILVLLPAWLSFVFLRQQDDYAALILLLLAVVAAADIGAFFTGRAFGRHKLSPRVSPNKTWEGFWGGVGACCLLGVLAAGCYSLLAEPLPIAVWGLLIVYSALLGTASTVGDLLESMVKRYRNIKDSGSILPGHGGVLDRIDGISAAAPVYALMVMSVGAWFA